MNESIILYLNTGLTTLVGLFLTRLLREHDKHRDKIDELTENVVRLETIIGWRTTHRKDGDL